MLLGIMGFGPRRMGVEQWQYCPLWLLRKHAALAAWLLMPCLPPPQLLFSVSLLWPLPLREELGDCHRDILKHRMGYFLPTLNFLGK